MGEPEDPPWYILLFRYRDVFGLLDGVPIHRLLQYQFRPYHAANVEHDLIPLYTSLPV
jgi:hypothetical protein